MMVFRLLVSGGLGISQSCETVTVPSRSSGDVGLPAMLLINASWGFLFIDNGSSCCAKDWIGNFDDEVS